MWKATHLMLTPFSGNRDYPLPLATSMTNLVGYFPHGQRPAATDQVCLCSPLLLTSWSLGAFLPLFGMGFVTSRITRLTSCLWGVSVLCSERLSSQNRASSLMEEVRSVLLTVLTRWQNLWSAAVERWSYLQSIHIIRPLGACCYPPLNLFSFLHSFLLTGFLGLTFWSSWNYNYLGCFLLRWVKWHISS